MEAYEAILSRRSIRKYQNRPIEDELIERLIRAGMSAPSAHNEQPWHFVVIKDRAILDEIPKFHPYAKMLSEAPVAISVCADHALEKDPTAGYWIQDCSAATQNILLAAHALGLGACWLGIHPREKRKTELRKLLHLPESVEAFSVIALGYPAEDKKPSASFTPDRIHQNQW
jgi:nitroreductase